MAARRGPGPAGGTALGLIYPAVDLKGVTPRNGKNCTLRAGKRGGETPRRRETLETRRFRAISPRLKAWRNTLLSRHACAGRPRHKAQSKCGFRIDVRA